MIKLSRYVPNWIDLNEDSNTHCSYYKDVDDLCEKLDVSKDTLRYSKSILMTTLNEEREWKILGFLEPNSIIYDEIEEWGGNYHSIIEVEKLKGTEPKNIIGEPFEVRTKDIMWYENTCGRLKDGRTFIFLNKDQS